jgi:plastocyanin
MRIRCLGVSILLVTLLVSSGPALAANATVSATSLSTFSPKTVVINTGDMVTWNNGGGLHNVHFDDNSFIQPPTPSSAAWSVSRTFSSPGTFRYYCEVHGGPNGAGMSGTVWVNGPGYARPSGATPLRASLSVAYKQCQTASANRTHGPPLEHPACNPPVQESDWLTVGTPDVAGNGAAANSIGSVALRVTPGNAGPPDDADVQVISSVTDVRTKSNPLVDYSGELQVRLPLRITDRYNGGSLTEPATGDTTFTFAVPCATTSATGVGSTCSITTSIDALTPGAVIEAKRSVWQVDKIQVLDGGADGVASTAGNTLFMTQSIFVP